jgi:hypothetical protein
MLVESELSAADIFIGPLRERGNVVKNVSLPFRFPRCA